MHIETTNFILNQLFSNVNGYELSSVGKKNLGLEKEKSLTYGEVIVESMVDILDAVGGPLRGTFYDLGSGTGKAVLLAALLGNFDRVIGIEIVPELHAASVKMRDEYYAFVKPHLPEAKHHTIDFILADILTHDFSDGDVVFVQSTCFPEELMAAVERKLEKLKVGAKTVSLSRPIASHSFVVEISGRCRLGWGEATVYIQRKVA